MNTQNYSRNELDLVFGLGSSGDTPAQRAKTSTMIFVRSQIQLAPYSEGATGRMLSAAQALRSFGWDVLLNATREGYAALTTTAQEPSTTLRSVREGLGLTIEQIARAANVSAEDANLAEKPGARVAIRKLQRIAQALGLNEELLGFEPMAGWDSHLGVRLREMSKNTDISGFTAKTVLLLTEAAWVIARQDSLQREFARAIPKRHYHSLPPHDDKYGYPSYEHGFRLAAKTRRLLGIYDDSPIESVRKIVEEDLGLPLVQLQMDPDLAGATIANEAVRGIVVNEAGMNSNVWVRRMTLCHELGHLLWDPAERLNRVKVDEYAELNENDRTSPRDPSEIRANAFAVAFLAPPDAVRVIARSSENIEDVIRTVMTRFGISATAAKYHVGNITGHDVSNVRPSSLGEPDDHWSAMENLAVDYFPIKSVPISRRGKFAWYVVKSYLQKEISLDSAAAYLDAESSEVSDESLRRVLELWEE